MPELRHTFSEGEVIAGNYRVLSVAGSGGMGVVYRALDLRLERTVALKFLPPEFNTSQRDKERFLREARTASSLDHPNIGVIHGIEEMPGGRSFIVMAFYEGASLADRLRNGPLPVHEAIQIASQMASGLAEAHSRGIVHRDIKPSNVMLTPSGLVKIVDFGLARIVSEQTASQIGITGTVCYMSPEQVMGRQVDQRCDIWALGVVFAEMLTGASPFTGDNVPAMVFAILNEAPHNIESVHPALQPVIYRALTKDVSRRYASCGAFLADLGPASDRIPVTTQEAAGKDGVVTQGAPRSKGSSARNRRARADASRFDWTPPNRQGSPLAKWLLGALTLLVVPALVVALIPPLRQRAASMFEGGPSEKHIAVLPFDNTGSNPENAALADGLMDSLADRLSNLEVGNQSLWVVPNIEVRRLKVNGPSDALKVLGASLVVKGSVRRDGEDVHLTVNLIDTKKLRQIGSAEVESHSGDLSALEDEAVSRLAGLMRVSAATGAVHNSAGTVSPAAYEQYLSALGYIQRFDKPGNLDLAISTLKTSVFSDPQFALGYAELGEAYRLRYEVSLDSHWLDEAQANCRKAEELDSRIPSVYVTLARIHNLLGKPDLALQEFHQALDLDPRNAIALGGLARFYASSGRIADAEKTFQVAAAMRPDDWYGYNSLGAFYDGQGKYARAIAAYRQALRITPDNAEIWSNLAAAYLDSGDQQSLAEEALLKSIALAPSYSAYANLGMLYIEQKRYAEAAGATEQALRENGNDYSVWNNLMLAYQGLRQPEKAATARHRAQELAEKKVELSPRDALAQSALATFFAYDKRNEKARDTIQTCLALAPDDPNVLFDIGEAYEFMGNRGLAVKYVEKSLQKGYALQNLQSDPNMQALVADPRFKPSGT